MWACHTFESGQAREGKSQTSPLTFCDAFASRRPSRKWKVRNQLCSDAGYTMITHEQRTCASAERRVINRTNESQQCVTWWGFLLHP